METMCLYLLLTIKPRLDDTNMIKCYPTEQCEALAKGYNELHTEMMGDKPPYTWTCAADANPVEESYPESEKTSQSH